MKRLGFDHVRLSIDAAPLVAWQRHAARRRRRL